MVVDAANQATKWLLLAAVIITAGCVSALPQKPVVPFRQLPVVPGALSEHSKTLISDGLRGGNRANVFSKLGDCMTDSDRFLKPLAPGNALWGEATGLQPVYLRFAGTSARLGRSWSLNSFATPSLAAAGGFNVAGPLDATWADPTWCAANESPLACEYRVTKPIVSIIMFGTNDVATTDDKTYEQYLRQIVRETTDRNILPVLSTFPTRPENATRSDQLNQIVANVAVDMDIPLVNLNVALESLPNKGVDADNSTHLSLPTSGRADDFTKSGQLGGANMRNLLTLRLLDLVTRSLPGGS